MTPDRGREVEREDVRRLPLPADLVRTGDTVVFTGKRNQEYRFIVAETDPTWLTFRTGQMVHRDRYEREDFAVVRPTAERSTTAGEDRTETAADATEGYVAERDFDGKDIAVAETVGAAPTERPAPGRDTDGSGTD